MNTEQITYEIQQIKGSARAPKTGAAESTTLSPPSIADTTMTEEDGKSMATSGSIQSESGIHASQITIPTPFSVSGAAAAAAAAGGGGQDAQQQADAAALSAPKVSRKTKRQLWDDLTISGEFDASTLCVSSYTHTRTHARTFIYHVC